MRTTRGVPGADSPSLKVRESQLTVTRKPVVALRSSVWLAALHAVQVPLNAWYRPHSVPARAACEARAPSRFCAVVACATAPKRTTAAARAASTTSTTIAMIAPKPAWSHRARRPCRACRPKRCQPSSFMARVMARFLGRSMARFMARSRRARRSSGAPPRHCARGRVPSTRSRFAGSRPGSGRGRSCNCAPAWPARRPQRT